MSEPIELSVNGERCRVDAEGETPLLYVLRNGLGLRGPRFGCGLAQCGACTVHVNGEAVRSCVYPLALVGDAAVTTLEGLGGPDGLHPVQKAFVNEQAAQCGYCINGWIMTAAALLKAKPNMTDAELREGLSGLKCRCGTHLSLLRAVKRAAIEMTQDAAT